MAIGILAISIATAARARESATGIELGLKAAFLYKFSGYVEWPNLLPDVPLTFGVIADDGLADELTRIVRDRAPGARPVNVVRLRAFDELPPMHVLFIGRAESDRLAAIIRTARSGPVLIVTESDGALALGSMINFVVVDRHMRFEIGLGAAKRSGLSLSSRLLSVATNVSMRTP